MLRIEHLDDTALFDSFTNPAMQWRGAPFWSWNGRLEKDELLRQVHVLKEMGLGGFFMHSRTGLETEYLGEEWFELTNACADEGARLGMHTWLYDEDRWPSGTAGGMVTQDPAHRAKLVKLEIATGDSVDYQALVKRNDLLAAFVCDCDGVSYSNCQPLRDQSDLPGRTVLIFTRCEGAKSSFFNGNTEVDRLSLAATQRYIEITHERYRQACGNRLGKSIQGIFTDEPHRQGLMTSFGQHCDDSEWMVPWTDDLPELFAKRFGYDLIERLPEVFLLNDGQPVSQVKWHFVELLQQLFLENFAKPLYDWCEKHNLLLTGHVLHEDSLTAQVAMQGSLMRFYEYMHCPGIDVLTEGNRNYWVAKQLSSATRQLGQNTLMSELYGCTGWQMSFESHKAVGDWQALFGINLRCHHLSWYTMAGEAKRDYPASIFHQSGWYRDYGYVENYFARLGMLLSQGQPCCDVLVLNPIESVWARVYKGWCNGLSARDPEIKRLEETYAELFFWLQEAGIDFDYADEEMLSRLGSVEDEKLRVGKANYRCVIIPQMTTMRSSTLKLLDTFAKARGTVIRAGEAPSYVDALPSEEPRKLPAIDTAWQRDAVVQAARPHVTRPVEIIDSETGAPHREIFCQLRQDGDRLILVVLNTNPEQAKENVRLSVRANGHVTRWECATADRYAIAAEQRDDMLTWITRLPASGEQCYIISKQPPADVASHHAEQTVQELTIEGPMEYSLNEPNVCVLDLATYRIADRPWQDETEVLKIDRAVRDTFGLERRSGQMVQPWFREKFHPTPEVKGQVELCFAFQIETMPTAPIHLCVEKPDLFEIRINGHKITPAANPEWWVDIAFKKLPVAIEHLRAGVNTVSLTVAFTEHVDIEPLHLIGDFGVRLEGTRRILTTLPATLAIGDVVPQGLPFYSGTITYHCPIAQEISPGQRAKLSTPAFEAACIKVSSPAMPERIIAWQPYEVDITEAVRSDKKLAIQTVLTRRNTFGPLHQVPKRTRAYAPSSFVTEGEQWSDDYQLYPAGLLAAPVLRITSPAST